MKKIILTLVLCYLFFISSVDLSATTNTDALDDQYISYTSESSFDYKVGDTYVLALSKLDEDTEYSLLGNGYGAFKFDTMN